MKIIIGDGSGNLDYRTCAECGSDCESEPFEASTGGGIAIAFMCRQCGLHSVVRPFES